MQQRSKMEWLSTEDVLKLEPRLTPQLIGGAYEEESAQLNSYRLTLGLATAAEQLGARMMQRQVTGLLTKGGVVTGVKTTTGDISCGTVVVAAGVGSAEFGDWLGTPIPVGALKGERLILKYNGVPLPLLISSPKRGHMISMLDGFLSVGSTGGRDYDQDSLFLGDEFDRIPTEAALEELLGRAIDVMLVLENAELVEQLAGSRPLSPDRMPIIGPVDGWEGILLATGHSTKGVHLGPITGRVITDHILTGKSDVPVDLDAFLLSRFDAKQTTNFYASSLDVEE